MQDEKDRESDEKPSGEERRSSPLKPYSKPATPPEEAETISLLDLMAEESEGQGQKTIVLPPEAKTVELPPLVPSGSSTRPSQPTPTTDDQATPTATIRPPEPADTAPTPTTRDRAERPTFDAPESTPTVDDLEATTVQPRVAFPGATHVRPPAKPGSEDTTYIGARPSPARRPPAAPPGQRQAAPPTTQPKREQRPPQPRIALGPSQHDLPLDAHRRGLEAQRSGVRPGGRPACDAAHPAGRTRRGRARAARPARTAAARARAGWAASSS